MELIFTFSYPGGYRPCANRLEIAVDEKNRPHFRVWYALTGRPEHPSWQLAGLVQWQYAKGGGPEFIARLKGIPQEYWNIGERDSTLLRLVIAWAFFPTAYSALLVAQRAFTWQGDGIPANPRTLGNGHAVFS